MSSQMVGEQFFGFQVLKREPAYIKFGLSDKAIIHSIDSNHFVHGTLLFLVWVSWY